MSKPITASMLYNLVSCPHRVERDLFADPAEKDEVSAFVEMLWDRGNAWETKVVEELPLAPLDLKGIDRTKRGAATLAAMRDGAALIYGGWLEHGDLVGEPDLLRAEAGGYVAIDIKSGRGKEGGGNGPDDDEPGKPKKEYAVQLAHYTHLLERLGFSPRRHAYVWDVHRSEVEYAFDEPQGKKTPETWWAYYERQLAAARAIAARQQTTRPALASICKLCHWGSACTKRAEESMDLTLVPELGRSRRDQLATLFPDLRAFADADLAAAKAAHPEVFKGLGDLPRRLQARARLQLTGGAPYATQPLDLPTGDTILYFDVETDPMLDFCYLHGFWVVEHGRGRFVEFHTNDASPAEERRAFAEAVAFVRAHADAPVVHYSPYERVTFRSLGAKYPDVISSEDAEALMQPPRAFDLYHRAVRPFTEWPTRDYSIKSLAKKVGFQWRDRNPSGAASIEWFQQWLRSRAPEDLQRILDYNEDDCIAMQKVLDALRTLPVKG